jgi:hypothetical protein
MIKYHDQVKFISEIQDWFHIENQSIKLTNKQNESKPTKKPKHHKIISVDGEKNNWYNFTLIYCTKQTKKTPSKLET